MKYSELKQNLKEHKLRVTDCRMDVLEHFQQQKRALSFRDLEDRFQEYDRVTLYRTLHSFEENGLLHKIPGDSGSAVYGLCNSCGVESHHHNHMHFKCTSCGVTECIDTPINIPSVSLPKDYKMSDMDVIINGLCKLCNN
ncbi:Fur family transcriptional regulator [Marinoscillum pacificum]|uniref:Fur family transcriptional regulator n=1 Tax=Marinoscillum pacificum TaxID=392723 RepID=UPI00215766BA|nr:Fur family transcriptional regulator [Marinoscillum pacificum]